MYQDFIFRIENLTAEGGYRYFVDTPSGGIEGVLTLPFGLDEVPRVLEGLEKWVRSAGNGSREVTRVAKAALDSGTSPLELGRQLFRGLFSGRVLQLYGRCQSGTGRDGGLRIKLRLDARPELYALPWELLYDDELGDFLVLSRWSPIVRYLDVLQEVPSTALEPPLRVLVVEANPAGSAPLDLERERLGIEQALAAAVDSEIEVVEGATLQRLDDRLQNLRPNVVHYMGHGSLDPENGEGYLLFQDDAGRPVRARATLLANLLRESRSVRLVLLNACETARTSPEPATFQPFAGVATALVRAGVPAVVAMQFPVSDRAAITFCGSFYHQLVEGQPLEAAVAQARRQIRLANPETLEWATPVLFLRTASWSTPVRSEVSQPSGDTAGKDPLEPYLRWIVEQHQSLQLPLMPQGGRRQSVPLESVYVALRGDLSSSYERAQSQTALAEQARRLEDLAAVEGLTPEQRSRMVWRQISLVARDPLPTSIEERDRPRLFGSETRASISLGEAFRRERCLVILGDPGSGKTTLARWLTLRLAEAALHGEDRVWVPTHQLDPAADPDEGDVLDLGPARIPIFLRVAAFARAWQADPSLTLAAFLGRSAAEPARLDPKRLGERFRRLLEEGRAVVLLDGLDEISDPADRHEIVRAIDGFLDEHLYGRNGPNGTRRRTLPTGPPSNPGGNQVVITSRIVGYQMAPLGEAAAHFTIEAMTDRAVDRFCDLWVRAVHRAAREPRGWDAVAEAAAGREAEDLKRAIADLRRRGAGELASNPLLVTILALVFRQGRASFPQQRARLYELTVGMLIQQWRESARSQGGRVFGERQVRALLAPLAAEIHEHSGIGAIDEAQLKASLEKRLDGPEVDAFLTVVREEVGLLAARGEGVYGFLHLTFQEYLAGCFLVADPNRAAALLIEKLTAPRWREPILMGLGQLSGDMAEAGFEALLLDMLGRPDPLGHLVPRAALLLAEAVPEMVKVSERVIGEIVSRLLTTYGDREALNRFPPLREQIERTLARLVAGEHHATVDRVLLRALREPARPDDRLAAAELIRVTARFTPEIAEALSFVVEADGVLWRWPIDRALRAIAAHDPGLLPSSPGSLRRILLAEPELSRRFLAWFDWVRLGIALYGGINESHLSRIVEAQAAGDRLRRKVQILTAAQAPEDQAKLASLQEDLVRSQDALVRAQASGFWFSPARMHRDAPGLTLLVVEALREGQPPSAIVPRLWEMWNASREPGVRRDALLALIALGEPVDPARGPDGALPRDVAAQLSRISQTLRDAVPRTLRQTLTALRQLAASVPWERWVDLLRAILDVVATLGHGPVDLTDLEAAAPEPARSAVLAEILSFYFSGVTEHPVYDMAVFLDNYAAAISTPPLKLAQALAAAPAAINSRRAREAGWALDPLSFRPETPADLAAAALDAIAAMPVAFVQNWALGRLRSLFDVPGLLLEALIVGLGIHAGGDRTEALRDLAGNNAGLLALLEDPSPAGTLLQWAQRITDPVSRFRCLWRLLQSFPDLHTHVLGLLGTAAEAIENPRWRTWAFEQLAAFGEPARKRESFARARDAARRISSAANRALALGRLAVRLPVEVPPGPLLEQALHEAGRIANPRERVDVLRAIEPLLSGEPELTARFRETADGFGDDLWNQARALGRNALPLLEYGASLAKAGGDMGLLLLGALVSDLRRQLSLPDTTEGLWTALATGRHAFSALIQRARANGLPLTAEAAAALERSLATQDAKTVLPLLTLVQKPEFIALPVVESWLGHPDPSLRRQAHLLLAEGEGISEETIPALLELLEDPEDRLRYRAALVLHGDGSDLQRPLTARGIGIGAVAALARAYLRHLETKPQISQVLLWALARLEHDDGRALSAWASLLGSPRNPDAGTASFVLSDIQVLHENAWPAFRDLLASGPPNVQRALLQSLSYLLYHGQVSDERWATLVPILQALGPEATARRPVMDMPGVLTDAVEAALTGVGETAGLPAGEWIPTAERTFAQAGTDMGSILRRDPVSMRVSLAAVGELAFVSSTSQERIRRAAERIEQAPERLGFLLTWLVDRLRRRTAEAPDLEEDLLTNNLLCVVAAAAERLPNTFVNAARAHLLLERLLCETAQRQAAFDGRQAALTLLSYLRRVTSHVTAALAAGLGDAVHVQEVALRCVARFREIEPDLLPRLFADLLAASPAAGYATVGLLEAIARNVHLPPEVRSEIIAALAASLQDERSRRAVYLLKQVAKPGECSRFSISYEGQLDQTIYRAMVQLAGISDLGSSSARIGSAPERDRPG